MVKNEGPVNEARPDMTGAIEITDDMKRVGPMMQKNAVLQAIETVLQEGLPGQPELQMGVLAVAQALAFGRVRKKNNLVGARRKFVLERCLGDIKGKIKKFGYEDRPEPDTAETQ